MDWPTNKGLADLTAEWEKSCNRSIRKETSPSQGLRLKDSKRNMLQRRKRRPSEKNCNLDNELYVDESDDNEHSFSC